MWRPKEGWFNAFTVEAGNLHPEADKEANIYEAGADAMLEALKNNPNKSFSQHVDAGLTVTEWPVFFKESGYLVFIPEEEE